MSISTAGVPSRFRRAIFSSPEGWVTAISTKRIQISGLKAEVRYYFEMVATFQRRTIEDDLTLFGNQVFIAAVRGELAGNGEPQLVSDDLFAKQMKCSLRAAAASRAVMSEVRRLQVIFEVCDQRRLAVRTDQAAGKAAPRL